MQAIPENLRPQYILTTKRLRQVYEKCEIQAISRLFLLKTNNCGRQVHGFLTQHYLLLTIYVLYLLDFNDYFIFLFTTTRHDDVTRSICMIVIFLEFEHVFVQFSFNLLKTEE